MPGRRWTLRETELALKIALRGLGDSELLAADTSWLSFDLDRSYGSARMKVQNLMRLKRPIPAMST